MQKCTSYCSQFVVPAWPHNVGTCQSDRPPLRLSEGERGNGCGERGGVSRFLVDEHPPRLWTDHFDSQEFCQKAKTTTEKHMAVICDCFCPVWSDTNQCLCYYVQCGTNGNAALLHLRTKTKYLSFYFIFISGYNLFLLLC